MAAPQFASLSPPARRNTPETLRRLIALLWAADVILLIASLVGVDIHRRGLLTVGKDAAPSIIAAQHVKSSLADMDAEAANGLLVPSGQEDLPVKAYEARRQEAAEALINAAENITYGESERKPIRALQLGLGTYEGRIQRARDLYERHEPGFLIAYKQAAAVMDSTLLPAADELDQANLRVLESVYESQGTRSLVTRGIVLVAAILLLYTMISVQAFLSRRMNRTLNLPLVAATLLTLGWSGWVISTLSSEQHLLKSAKEDAFVSEHALWRARATAYSANADESRFLLDKVAAGAHAADFNSKTLALMNVPDTTTADVIEAAAQTARKTPKFSGYLADELNNITFPGEQVTASKALVDFIEYLRIDKEMRRLEQTGKHKEAVALCTGTGTGESNWAFAKFDKSLGETLAINQKAFDSAVNQAFSELGNFELKTSVAAVVIALLVLAGLMQRIAEYR